jgi:hypothetical protein
MLDTTLLDLIHDLDIDRKPGPKIELERRWLIAMLDQY